MTGTQTGKVLCFFLGGRGRRQFLRIMFLFFCCNPQTCWILRRDVWLCTLPSQREGYLRFLEWDEPENWGTTLKSYILIGRYLNINIIKVLPIWHLGRLPLGNEFSVLVPEGYRHLPTTFVWFVLYGIVYYSNNHNFLYFLKSSW